MALNYTVETLEGLDEATQKLYQKDGEKYVLQVTGVVSQSDADALKTQLEDAKALANGPEGKTYKEMFEGSQTANAAIRKERDGFKSELDAWKAFGTLDEVKGLKDELDGLKAKGQKLDEAQTQIVTLKQQARELEGKVTALEGEKKSLADLNKELSLFKADAEKKADLFDAQERINQCVDGIQEANKKALKLQLQDRYQLGHIVRNDKGELVSKEDGKNLLEYAKEMMTAYNLTERSQSGYPLNNQTKPTPKNGGDVIDDLFAQTSKGY